MLGPWRIGEWTRTPPEAGHRVHPSLRRHDPDQVQGCSATSGAISAGLTRRPSECREDGPAPVAWQGCCRVRVASVLVRCRWTKSDQNGASCTLRFDRAKRPHVDEGASWTSRVRELAATLTLTGWIVMVGVPVLTVGAATYLYVATRAKIAPQSVDGKATARVDRSTFEPVRVGVPPSAVRPSASGAAGSGAAATASSTGSASGNPASAGGVSTGGLIVPPTRAALARQIQAALVRAGCYDGPVDGRWTVETKDAMRRFSAAANARLPVDQPDEVLLTLVQSDVKGGCRATTGEPPVAAVTAGLVAVAPVAVAAAAGPPSTVSVPPAGPVVPPAVPKAPVATPVAAPNTAAAAPPSPAPPTPPAVNIDNATPSSATAAAAVGAAAVAGAAVVATSAARPTAPAFVPPGMMDARRQPDASGGSSSSGSVAASGSAEPAKPAVRPKPRVRKAESSPPPPRRVRPRRQATAFDNVSRQMKRNFRSLQRSFGGLFN